VIPATAVPIRCRCSCADDICIAVFLVFCYAVTEHVANESSSNITSSNFTIGLDGHEGPLTNGTSCNKQIVINCP
jgi:hypothetical protein